MQKHMLNEWLGNDHELWNWLDPSSSSLSVRRSPSHVSTNFLLFGVH